MANLPVIVCTVLVLSSVCDAYKVLVLYPFPAKSHNTLGNAVVRHLLKAGHEVTYVTPYPLTSSNPNLKQVDVGPIEYPASLLNVQSFMNKEIELDSDNTIFFSMLSVVEKIFKADNVLKLLNDQNQKFDVLVAEYMFTNLYSGFAAAFDCPYLWILPYEPYVNALSVIEGPPNPAYVTHLVSQNVPPLNFYQRLQELFTQTWSLLLHKFYHSTYETELYERVFAPILAKRGRPLPPFEELKYNASLVLGTTHPSFGLATPLPQNFKSIAGFHIEESVKPLPDDLQKLMDNAKHGVVYFSLGSNLKSKDFPHAVKKELIQVLGELDETVIWKFEEAFEGLPENVHVMKWAPQQSILAHPNCKVFITHGGLLSTMETVHFGVPSVGIPVFCDQFGNVNRLVHKGAGRRVDLSHSLAANLRAAIKEITADSRYGERARELSLVYHDRPTAPGAELVHWVEHAVRSGGAPLLRSPALQLPLYKKLYLDAAACLLLLLALSKMFINRLVSKCFKKNSRVQKKKNK